MESTHRLEKQILPIAISVSLVNWTLRSMFGPFDVGVLILTVVFTCVIFAGFLFCI